MGMKNRRGNQKSPPIFSHEFIIQNHADIVSCVAMVFVVGLMFQATGPIATLFVAVNHNVTFDAEDGMMDRGLSYYTYGIKDLSTVFFYFLISIIVHAVVQEYMIDRLNRKMHLSKVNHRKFNESGQLLFFYVCSVIWGMNIAYKEGLLVDLPALWSNYPEAHARMTFQHKFFFILQLSYWLHQFPELYFQKVKKDEMWQRVQLALQYFLTISVAYVFNFTKLALVLLIIHYACECVFHVARILHFANKIGASKRVFQLRNAIYLPVRLSTITLSVLMFYFGLAKEKQGFDFATGNFNVHLVRINCLIFVSFLQAWLLWNFTTFHLKRRRERAQAASASKKKQQQGEKKKKAKSTAVKSEDQDVNELPEVDQNTSKDLRQRK